MTAVQRSMDLVRAVAPRQARRQVLATRLAWRRTTQASRVLPDFLVIGAMRAGTSSLYKWLSYHPNVAPSLRKETEYFTRYYRLGTGWYKSHFPLRIRQHGSRPRQAFEATPYYLYHPLAPTRAAALLPHARVIVLLRDPIDRAWSHHRHMTKLGFESLPFHAAVECEPERLAGEADRLRSDPRYDSPAHRRFSYLTRGCYAEQLERWFACYPRDRFLILHSQDLYTDPGESYRRVLEFLELPTEPTVAFRNYSYRWRRPHPSEPLPDHLRVALDDWFRPHNQRLARLLGDASPWVTEWVQRSHPDRSRIGVRW